MNSNEARKKADDYRRKAEMCAESPIAAGHGHDCAAAQVWATLALAMETRAAAARTVVTR